MISMAQAVHWGKCHIRLYRMRGLRT